MKRNSETPDLPSVVSEIEPEVEASFNEFWRGIVMPGGMLDLDQVKRELHDYQVLLEEVPKVYCEVTRGRISKPNTAASAVIGVHDEVCHSDWDDSAWRELALAATRIDTVMAGIGAAQCAFCHVWCRIGMNPEHNEDCLVLRAEALLAAERIWDPRVEGELSDGPV